MALVFGKVVIVVNRGKPGSVELASVLQQCAVERGCEVRLLLDYPAVQALESDADLVLVVGGDGTLLAVAGFCGRHGIPVLGVNRGKLGFLTPVPGDDAVALFGEILDGRFRRIERNMLEGILFPSPAERMPALNDIVIKGGSGNRLASLRVFADGEAVTTYTADGLILSTPTGSTAYNLSAGGPIMTPGSKVFCLTPICPHTLSNRSLVFHEDAVIRIQNLDPGDAMVSFDGMVSYHLVSGGELEVSIASQQFTSITPADFDPFRLLSSKLGWSGGASVQNR